VQPAPQPLLRLLIATLLAAGCQSSSEADLRDAEGRELGPNDFLPDLGEDAADIADAVDLTDASDAEDEAEIGVGRPCQLLQGDCDEGLKCVPSFDGTGVCRFLAAIPLAAGEPCGRRGLDDCEAGHLCVSPDADSGLRCFRICDAETGTGCLEATACSTRLPLLIEAVGICL
jgi:hypothetical protein